VLTGLAANLRLELRRTFEHDLPLVEASPTTPSCGKLRMVTTNLRLPSRARCSSSVARCGARFEEGRVFDDQAARRSSERLRRDVWMFAQITRAFAMKARAANPEGDRWTTMASFAFVREFLAYFRAMGYPLLRAGDYPRVDAFMAAIGGLEENDAVDAAKLEAAVAECEAFYLFLVKLFESISQRDELSDVPFDRLAAAKALKLYLGRELEARGAPKSAPPAERRVMRPGDKTPRAGLPSSASRCARSSACGRFSFENPLSISKAPAGRACRDFRDHPPAAANQCRIDKLGARSSREPSFTATSRASPIEERELRGHSLSGWPRIYSTTSSGEDEPRGDITDER
jgi:hypothetical protein